MSIRRRGCRPAALGALLIGCSAQSFAAEPSFYFDIPETDAQRALQQWMATAKIPTLWQVDTFKGVRTRAVVGDLDPITALQRLFEGTNLDVHLSKESVLVVRERASGKSLVEIDTAQIRGDQPGRTSISQIEVLGTYLQSVAELSAPIVHIDESEIQRATYATVQDAVTALPTAMMSGPSEFYDPGGNFGRGTGIDLRGLGSQATLVLINGHRKAASGANADFVDVSHIPWSAVERIDVLPEGASATYGADAIAGVVNIVLKKSLDGAQTTVRWSNSETGTSEQSLSQLIGTEWSGGGGLFTYQFSERAAIAAADRWYAADADKRAFSGSNFRSPLGNPGTIYDLSSGTPAFGIPRGQDGSSLSVAQLSAVNTYGENQLASMDLSPRSQTHSVFGTVSQRFSESTALEAEVLLAERRIDQRHIPEAALLLVPADNPFAVDPFDSGIVGIGYSFSKDLGPVSSVGRTRYLLSALEMLHALRGDWESTLSVAHSLEYLSAQVRNQLDREALAEALRDLNPSTAFNAFGDGSNSNPDTIDSIRRNDDVFSRSTTSAFTFRLDGPLWSLGKNDARLAIGAERREESLRHGPVSEVDLSRAVTAEFAEVFIPLTTATEGLAPRLSLSAAGRWEAYENRATKSFSPKFGLNAVLSSRAKLRATWGTSFRPPSIARCRRS